MGKLGITQTAFATALAAATAVLANPTTKETLPMKDATWKLQTDDTALQLAVTSNRLFITGLKHTGQQWEWVPAPAEVPMPGKGNLQVADTMASPVWVYQDAVETKTSGYLVVLRFTSDSPALELKSYWQALPGCGPVENWVTIENQSAASVEARDRQLAAVLKRYDEGWFDMWRTDKYNAPHDPMPSTYQGILNFQYIMDHLIANRPGFRYENCANGGKFKGFNTLKGKEVSEIIWIEKARSDAGPTHK